MTIKGRASCLLVVGLLGCSAGAPTDSSGFGSDQPASQGGGGNNGAGGTSNGGATGGGTHGDTTNGSGSGGASGGGSGGGSASYSGSSSGGASGPVYSDAAAGNLYDVAAPDASGSTVYTFKMDTFSVAPGAEVYKCQQIGNPFGGKDVDFIYFEGQMSAGSHHFFLFSMDSSTGRTQAAPLGDCLGKGIEFHPFPYGSMQPNFNVGYPEQGMGYHFTHANGLMLNSHYLNSGTTPLTAQVQVKVTVAAPGTVTKYVGTLFLNNSNFTVPANVPQSRPIVYSATTTPLQKNFQILTSISHMHQTATLFTVSANGAPPFYTEKDWNEPKLVTHSPYLSFSAGTSFTWGCTYYNPTSSALTFGDSAVTNVMCIYMAQYYPADPSNPDVISVLNGS
ncbi:MAG TPA: hypothetical protein VKU41_04280 [Polyangiaceae bacterium]|nr:hypothetical protein [Polyangiaceae bacterium]